MGQSVQQILAADPDYIRWIIEESSMDSAIKVYLMIERNRLLHGH